MPEKLIPFLCNSCGKCCQRVNLSEQTRYLDRGDGVCQYFNETSNLCSIYHSRPLVCRVEEYYKKHFSHLYKWEEFIQMNLEICNKL